MNGTYLPPRVIQILGILLLVGSAAFWALTGRESILLMTSAMTLIGVGGYQGAVNALKRAKNGNGNGNGAK